MSYGQQPDSIKRRAFNYYRHLLNTDTATARQVSEIQGLYKQAVSQVTGNLSLTEAQRRIAIDSLLSEKNRKLEQLLPESQRSLIIPTTERKRTWKRDTITKVNR
ncbi:hypothetical protein [Mucilaginibacter flavus]|uniref:hypothetical protein n=1 Tax=Mucilaginibacter flavus TaxID=931504 RepID=UPI0025B36A3A|nr:hypothetical protein [Mucilaginibacter flavus]MDN3579739.1 hypothetical protein [Mucilaginibacter flavus]